MKKGVCYGCDTQDVEVKEFYDGKTYCKYCQDTPKFMEGHIDKNYKHINRCFNILEKSLKEKKNV